MGHPAIRFLGRLAAALALVATLASETTATTNQFQLWTPAYLNLSFNDRVTGWYEVQPRFANGISQLILRTGLGYRFYGRWSGWLGYAWVPSFDPFRTENRIYQQLLYSDDFWFGRLTSRTRFEQRWIENTSGVALRLRTLLRDQVPLTDDGRWRFVGQDEVFVNLNSPTGGPASGFDQNRFFVGINRLFGPHLNVDVGYQLQWVNRQEPGFPDDLNHILLLQLFFDAAL